ncbi:hypothetical protein X766_33475 [Mesorhizobium sp. LSJC255A00]|nr:hypothetical protein X766_33475 [Mesorhizobium sp. LSJC255A00]
MRTDGLPNPRSLLAKVEETIVTNLPPSPSLTTTSF